MALLIPGLTEAMVKTLAKQLHEKLKAHPGELTLTQLQTLVVQAAGHDNWQAAQHHWQTNPAPISPASLTAAEEAMQAAFHQVLHSAQEHLSDARIGSRTGLAELPQSLNVLALICSIAQQPTAEAFAQEAYTLAKQVEGEFPFESEEDLDAIEALVKKTSEAFNPKLHGTAGSASHE